MKEMVLIEVIETTIHVSMTNGIEVIITEALMWTTVTMTREVVSKLIESVMMKETTGVEQIINYYKLIDII